MKKLFLVLTLVLFVSSFLGADIYVKNMERVEAFELMGKKQSEKVEIKEQWLGKNKFAQFGKEYSIIVDNNKEKIYIIIHKLKDYYVFPTSFDREKLLELLLGLNPKAAEVVESIKITDAKVNLSGEKKKIANWDCFSSEFEMVFAIPALSIMPKYKIKLWATKDVDFDYKSYQEGMGEFFGKLILGIFNIDENSIKELEKLDKIDGFQVAAEIAINIFGSEIKIESQSLEIAEKPAPPGTYSVPKGYTKKTIHLPSGLALF